MDGEKEGTVDCLLSIMGRHGASLRHSQVQVSTLYGIALRKVRRCQQTVCDASSDKTTQLQQCNGTNARSLSYGA